MPQIAAFIQSEVKPKTFIQQIDKVVFSQTEQSPLIKSEEGFFDIYTAASLNHKEARFFYSMFIENGLIPSPLLVQEVTEDSKKYNYLKFLVDVDTSLVFKYTATADQSYFNLSEFESDSKAQSLANLYLSAQIGSPYDLYTFEDDPSLQNQSKAKSFNLLESYSKEEIPDFGAVDESPKPTTALQVQKLNYLKQRRYEQLLQSVPAQSALGTRFQFGMHVDENCITSFNYYEAASRMTVEYVDRTLSLDSIDKQKLKLMGPHVLETGLQVEKVLRLDIFSTDVLDLLDLQGTYGNLESLNYLAISYMQGTPNIERNFQKSKDMFLKVLELDPQDVTANTNLGLIHMMGLLNNFIPEAQTALNYLENAPKEAKAINARAVIYYQAPDVFESDPDKLIGFQGVRKDKKKAITLFKEAAELGSTTASYNLGVIYLDIRDKEMFSFGQAYDHFKKASYSGHTLAAYNLAVMHYLGIGTFKSCQVAQAFMKHVAQIGENFQTLKYAYRLVEDHHYQEAAFIYMELAEAGLGIAKLNLAILLEKLPIFDTSRTLLGQLASLEFNKQGEKKEQTFDINKQMAFKYYQCAIWEKETEHEASFKVADFMYHGISGYKNLDQAFSIYKLIEQQTRDAELKSNSLFKIGMMYQFGEGGVVEVDHDLAQVYYEKALQQKSSVSAPVYLMSLYSKWQRLDVVHTVRTFVSETIEEPWSRGAIVVCVQLFYVLSVFGTVKLLRKESQREDN